MFVMMPTPKVYPQLHFAEPFESVAWQFTAKGFYSGAEVELADGSRYQVFFYDPVRLSHDLQAEAEAGRPYVAEPGMIVIPEITEANMRFAIERLHEEGWFKHLQPIGAAA